MVTEACSNVASRSTRSFGVRCVSLWPDYNRTHRAPLRGYVINRRLQQQEQSVTLCKNTKHQDRLALVFAARPDAVSVGSDVWILRAVQCTQRPSSRRQTTTTTTTTTTKTAVGVVFLARISARSINIFFRIDGEIGSIREFDTWKCDSVKIWISKSEPHRKQPNPTWKLEQECTHSMRYCPEPGIICYHIK